MKLKKRLLPIIVFFLLALILAAFLSAIWLYKSRTQHIDLPRSSGSVEIEEATQSIKITGNGITSDTLSSAKLPSESEPLRLAEAQLLALVEQGNSAAACRLALEYQNCKMAESQMRHAEDLEPASEQGELPIVVMTTNPEGFSNRVVRCEGVAIQKSNRVAELMRISAERGNVMAMAAYASGDSFSMSDILDATDELGLYRATAKSHAEQAISKGNGASLLALAAAYRPVNQSGPRSFLGQAVGDDLSESIALYIIARTQLIKAGTTDGDMYAFIEKQIEQLRARAPSSIFRNAELVAAEREIGMARLSFPPPSAIPMLRYGRTLPLKVGDCRA